MQMFHRYRKKLSFGLPSSWRCLFWLAALACSNVILADESFPVERIAPGIFLHQGVHEEMTMLNHGDIVNSGFIIGSTAVAVIDPGGSVRNARLLQAAIRQQTSLPVRYVVLTHIHPDHMAGVSVFPKSSEVVAHVNYPRALAQRGNFYFDRFPVLFGGDRANGLRVPDTLVDGRLRIDLGDRPLVIRTYPTAHTDNDLTVFDEHAKTLFASDLLFAQRTPSLDGSLTGWLRVLQQMSEDQQSDLVVPGHGRPGTWGSIAEPQVAYLSGLRDRVAEQIERGLTLSEALSAGTREENAEGWQLFAEVHPTNITKAYTELEWE